MRKGLMLIFLMALAVAQAQENPQAARPAAKSPVAPPPDQLEPAVDTGATPDKVPAPAASPAPGASSSSPAQAATAAPGGASDKKAAPAAPAATGASKSAARASKGTDRLELETTDITGNRELPKVLYIVPWKRSDLGDLVGKPANSLVDDVLQPIDREVFLRENRYYDALKPDVIPAQAGTVPGSGDRH